MVNSIPVTVNTGNAEIKMAIRLRVQVGIEAGPPDALPIPIDGITAAAVAFVNLAEFVGTLNKTEDCSMEAEALIDINIGAEANLGLDLGFVEFEVPAPSVQTTLTTWPIFGPTCLDGGEVTAIEPVTITAPSTQVSVTTSIVYTVNPEPYVSSIINSMAFTPISTASLCQQTHTNWAIPISNATIPAVITETGAVAVTTSTGIVIRKCRVPLPEGGNCPIDQLGNPTLIYPAPVSMLTTAIAAAESSVLNEQAKDISTTVHTSRLPENNGNIITRNTSANSPPSIGEVESVPLADGAAGKTATVIKALLVIAAGAAFLG